MNFSKVYEKTISVKAFTKQINNVKGGDRQSLTFESATSSTTPTPSRIRFYINGTKIPKDEHTNTSQLHKYIQEGRKMSSECPSKFFFLFHFLFV